METQHARAKDWTGLVCPNPELVAMADGIGDLRPPSFTDFIALPSDVDPNGIGQHEPGAKLDAGKVMPWLCISGFSRALEEVARVTTKGAEKYSRNGWKSVPDGHDRYLDAAMRHLLALGRGETVDADTGCLHHAQATWNLLASLELQLQAEAKP